MPTRIHLYSNTRAEAYAGRDASKLEQEQRAVVVGRGPWQGYVPDLPPFATGVNGFRVCEGVVARSRGQGEVLTHDDGYAMLAVAQSPSGIPSALVGGCDFRVPTNVIEPLFIWAGDGALVTVTLRRMTTAGALVSLTPNPNPLTTIANGDRDVLWDMAGFPAGAPTRNYATAGYSGILTPCMVMCGGDELGPTQPVLVTPQDPTVVGPPTGYDLYAELWETTFPGDLTIPAPLAYPFKAKSCEAFDGRMHWFNVIEGTAAFPNRLRWSAVGTCDASNQEIGSGYLDMWEFKRPGLRVETIGNQLALYFGDGVAFAVRTGSYVDPYRYQVVAMERGLLSTHAVCAYAANVHFGIFTDGWWKLNFAGQWQPVGVIEVTESGEKSVLLPKWKDTFYSMLDLDRRHLISTVFDPWWRRILIAFPVRNVLTNRLMVWSYDVDVDRVWPLGFMDVTQWASIDRTLKAATVWNSVTSTWDTTPGTWDSYGARYGLRSIIHGDAGGYLWGWDPDISTKAGASPSAYWTTHAFSPSKDPDITLTMHKYGLRYVSQQGGGNYSVSVVGQGGTNQTQARTFQATEGTQGSIQWGYSHFRTHGEQHEITVSTLAPFEVREVRAEWLAIDGDNRVAQP